MEKIEYLARTFSRTKRKDYENYILNAVWQQIGCMDLQPISQYYIERKDGKGAFIDLYFPQVNIGIECDEGYHNSSHQTAADKKRKKELIDVIRQIKPDDATYQEKRIPLFENGKPRAIASVNSCISSVAKDIQREIKIRKSNGCWTPWELASSTQEIETQIKKLKMLSIHDDIGFQTIRDACRIVFGYSAPSGGSHFINKPETLPGHNLWFPQLSLDKTTPGPNGWNNIISSDGLVIEERNMNMDIEADKSGNRRITFLKMRDPILREKKYRFIGVFEFSRQKKEAGRKINIYTRTETKCPVLR